MVLANVPDYRMVYCTKMEETKRERFGDEVKKRRSKRGCILYLKARNRSFVLFICVHQLGLGGRSVHA